MKLLITDPVKVIVDHIDVAALRAEDASGGFGILPGHADFLTALAVSVVSWRHDDGRSGRCAVRAGVLTVRGGNEIAIATREAVLGDANGDLAPAVIAHLWAHDDAERKERVAAARLQVQIARQIMHLLQPEVSASEQPS